MSNAVARKLPVTVPLMNTSWQCEQCQERGVIQHEDGATIGALMKQLEDAHARYSPHCRYLRSKMRIMVGYPR
jgi:hypothetical protein